MPVQSLHGVTPAEIIQDRFDELGLIDNLVMAWTDKEGQSYVAYSNAEVEVLCMLSMLLEAEVKDLLYDG